MNVADALAALERIQANCAERDRVLGRMIEQLEPKLYVALSTMEQYQAAREAGTEVYLRDARNDDEPGEEPSTFGLL
jgi:hypothetical protein